MQVTQIFFDLVEADGRKWAAVIGQGAGGRTFHSLRGTGSVRKPRRQGRGVPAECDAALVCNAIPSDVLAMFAGAATRR
jgi:hypothetical protein